MEKGDICGWNIAEDTERNWRITDGLEGKGHVPSTDHTWDTSKG